MQFKTGNMQPKKYDLEARLIEFAVNTITLVENLPETRVANHLGSQVLRSSTSTALNYGEAQAAESRKDFIHKINITLKELRETSICFRILQRKGILSDSSLLEENKELIAIFAKSVSTAKGKP